MEYKKKNNSSSISNDSYYNQTGNKIYSDDYEEPLDRKNYRKYDENNIFAVEVKENSEIKTKPVDEEEEKLREIIASIRAKD